MAADLDTEYHIAADDVWLVVTIGEGQHGRTLVQLDDTRLKLGDVRRLKIGPGADLAGKKLLVRTMINDVNDMTNFAGVRYELQGGKANETFDLDGTVDEEGASVTFEATFTFKA